MFSVFTVLLWIMSGDLIGEESVRTVDFNPGDHPIDLSSVDWKTRYNELKNRRDWDPNKQFVGMQRLGDSYHPLDPFFKFEGVPKEQLLLDRILIPTVVSVLGLGVGAYANYTNRRPFFSSIITTLLTGVLFGGAAELSWRTSRKRAAERDAVLIHYMILHENQLPIIGMKYFLSIILLRLPGICVIERKRFGQLMNPWIPFRVGIDGIHVKK